MAGPNVIGLLAIIFFGVVDTMWVGRLGHRELAAMAFCFPLSFIVLSIPIGLGIAMMSGVSRAVGAGDETRAKRLVTDVLALATLVMLAVGWATSRWIADIFEALGAEPSLGQLSAEYMRIYLMAMPLLAIPMVGNGALRARGDTRSPATIMVILGIVNAVLDPFLIFGIGPLPALGLQGAALATAVAWLLATVAELHLLVKRDRLIDFALPAPRAVLASWAVALYVAVPAAASSMVMPSSVAVLTRLVASHGHEAVAGYGVGGRVEMLAMVGIMAMSIALSPFVGQNAGAGAFDRVNAALAYAFRFAWKYGIVVMALLALLAHPLARAFSDSEPVREVARLYFWTVPVGYGAYGTCQLIESSFNALNRPLRATFLAVLRLGGLTLPLAFVGSELFGLRGLLAALPVGNVLGAGVALLSLRRLRRAEHAARVAVSGSPGGLG